MKCNEIDLLLAKYLDGLLDEKDFETVIERAMMAGYEKLSVQELREIVASVLFARGGDDASGNRSMLTSGDTIH